MSLPLLQIRDATKVYSSGGFLGTSQKSVVALDNFNMTIGGSPATITTIAGESGSGKTTLANLVLGFIKLTSGNIIFDGEDITDMTDEQLKDYRRNVQAVFQDPFGVYNPFYRIDHIFDLVNKHFSLSDNQSEYRDMVEAGLNVVGLYGEDVLRKYPHQLSGGQRQRIMMSRAYMIKPRLIVADEPVSMVDASLRASILDAMLRLRDDHNISFLYITHDLSTAYQIGDQIYMLYQGAIAERGTRDGCHRCATAPVCAALDRFCARARPDRQVGCQYQPAQRRGDAHRRLKGLPLLSALPSPHGQMSDRAAALVQDGQSIS